MFCEQCGAELEPDARFCSTCGKQVQRVVQGISSGRVGRSSRQWVIAGSLVMLVLSGALFWVFRSEGVDIPDGNSQLTREHAQNVVRTPQSGRDLGQEALRTGSATGSSKDLTRDLAARMIVQHKGYPKPVEGQIDENTFYDVWDGGIRSPEKELEQRGLIKTRDDCTRSQNTCYVVIELTDEGKKYFIRREQFGSGPKMVVKTCEETFLRVTGILPAPLGFAEAKVEYEITYDNPTPFSSARPYGGGRPCRDELAVTNKRGAYFQLYDDGWRIK